MNQTRTHADETTAVVVSALIECKLISGAVMAALLENLANTKIAQAKRLMREDQYKYPADLFDQARKLLEVAAGLTAQSKRVA